MGTGRNKMAIVRDSQNTLLVKILLVQTANLKLSLREIAQALDWRNTSTVAAMLKGTMNVPFNKIKPLATLMEIDPVTLLQAAYPDHFKILRDIFRTYPTSANEQAFIDMLRNFSGGQDVYPETPNEVESFKNLVKEIVDRKMNESKPNIERKNKQRQVAGFDPIQIDETK